MKTSEFVDKMSKFGYDTLLDINWNNTMFISKKNEQVVISQVNGLSKCDYGVYEELPRAVNDLIVDYAFTEPNERL